jgi:predicted MFS family arabinose efflux permease
MGIQGASVGAGVMLVTTLAGIVGKTDFHNVYYISILAFVAFLVILLLLPERPVSRGDREERKRIRLNAEVWRMAAFIFAEGFFIIVFTTNLSMHLAGTLKGDTAVAGTITGVFSAAQILMGVLLGLISRVTKHFTLPVAMFALAAGYLLMVFFPDNLPVLLVSAVLCGYSQSVYCSKSMAEVTTVVDPQSTPMAASLLTCALFISQFISPVVINGLSRLIFGEVTTTGAYAISSAGIFIVGVLGLFWKRNGNYNGSDQTASAD